MPLGCTGMTCPNTTIVCHVEAAFFLDYYYYVCVCLSTIIASSPVYVLCIYDDIGYGVTVSVSVDRRCYDIRRYIVST